MAPADAQYTLSYTRVRFMTLKHRDPGDCEVSHTHLMWLNLSVTLYKDDVWVRVSWKIHQGHPVPEDWQKTNLSILFLNWLSLCCSFTSSLHLYFLLCVSLAGTLSFCHNWNYILHFNICQNDFDGGSISFGTQPGSSISHSIQLCTFYTVRKEREKSAKLANWGFPRDKMTK